eukprot:scaffold289908_cov31-Tisochrysis_lutea.AAC.3
MGRSGLAFSHGSRGMHAGGRRQRGAPQSLRNRCCRSSRSSPPSGGLCCAGQDRRVRAFETLRPFEYAASAAAPAEADQHCGAFQSDVSLSPCLSPSPLPPLTNLHTLLSSLSFPRLFLPPCSLSPSPSLPPSLSSD